MAVDEERDDAEVSRGEEVSSAEYRKRLAYLLRKRNLASVPETEEDEEKDVEDTFLHEEDEEEDGEDTEGE